MRNQVLESRRVSGIDRASRRDCGCNYVAVQIEVDFGIPGIGGAITCIVARPTHPHHHDDRRAQTQPDKCYRGGLPFTGRDAIN